MTNEERNYWEYVQSLPKDESDVYADMYISAIESAGYMEESTW